MNYIIKCALCIMLLKSVRSYDTLISSNFSNEVTDNIYLLFYKGSTINNYTKIPFKDGLSISTYPEFNRNRETVLYFPGWSETPSKNEESVNTIASAFLEKKSVNLIVFDYSDLVQGGNILFYLNAVHNITDIGQAVGYFLRKYISDNVQDVQQLHLVGHSLGGQIMSKAAKAYGKGKLPWLTGLDPAGPLFNLPFFDHLSKEDGIFVDVIHTDGNCYGDGRSIGHVDFFPNMGTRVQPYCVPLTTYEFCSHHMSWRYYAESIRHEKAFEAKYCQYSMFCTPITMSLCCEKNANITYMGYAVDKNAHGDYYLKTNATAPFGLGKYGFYN